MVDAEVEIRLTDVVSLTCPGFEKESDKTTEIFRPKSSIEPRFCGEAPAENIRVLPRLLWHRFVSFELYLLKAIL